MMKMKVIERAEIRYRQAGRSLPPLPEPAKVQTKFDRRYSLSNTMYYSAKEPWRIHGVHVTYQDRQGNRDDFYITPQGVGKILDSDCALCVRLNDIDRVYAGIRRRAHAQRTPRSAENPGHVREDRKIKCKTETWIVTTPELAYQLS